MARFCYFWRLSPEQFHRLRWSEYQAMLDFMHAVNQANS